MSSRTQVSERTITDEKIAERAYQIWEARGCPESDGSDDWETAKQELLAEAAQSGRRQPFRNLLARLRSRAAM